MLERLAAQWHIDTEKMYWKRQELLTLLQQAGITQTMYAVTQCITHHHSEFCPTIATIRTYVPASPNKTSGHHRCSLCNGDFWVDAGFDFAGNHQVRRCPNFKNPEFQLWENA